MKIERDPCIEDSGSRQTVLVLAGGNTQLRVNKPQGRLRLTHDLQSDEFLLEVPIAAVGGHAPRQRPSRLADTNMLSAGCQNADVDFCDESLQRGADPNIEMPFSLHAVGRLPCAGAFPAPSARSEQLLGPMASVATRMAILTGNTTNQSPLQTNTVSLACTYHLGGGGRRVRARLALHAGLVLGLDLCDAVTIAVTAELVHNASLIHDDLQDRDRQRHGSDTVWVRFGDSVALCAGDLMLSGAYAALSSFSHQDTLAGLVALVHGAVISAVHGQSADSEIHATTDPRQGWYEAIAARKSGSLLSLPLELALFGAGQSAALPLARRAAEAFAVGYQIADDIEDVVADAKRQTAASTSNYVLALRQADRGGDAMSEARRAATDYLLLAANLAEDLPAESGHLLRDLSRQLMAAL